VLDGGLFALSSFVAFAPLFITRDSPDKPVDGQTTHVGVGEI
jgi:hypothetical protein